MFTDPASSTEFYEKYGDIEGRAMIQRHNDLLTPIVAKYGGQVLRVLGRGLMATFEIPPNAARAAVEIQRTLAEENRGKSPSEQIWVKAAIHHGLGIVEAGDVYGDMVNTLARICALTRKGDVQVSQMFLLITSRRNMRDIYYDYVGVKNLKGKSAPVVKSTASFGIRHRWKISKGLLKANWINLNSLRRRYGSFFLSPWGSSAAGGLSEWAPGPNL